MILIKRNAQQGKSPVTESRLVTVRGWRRGEGRVTADGCISGISICGGENWSGILEW